MGFKKWKEHKAMTYRYDIVYSGMKEFVKAMHLARQVPTLGK